MKARCACSFIGKFMWFYISCVPPQYWLIDCFINQSGGTQKSNAYSAWTLSTYLLFDHALVNTYYSDRRGALRRYFHGATLWRAGDTISGASSSGVGCHLSRAIDDSDDLNTAQMESNIALSVWSDISSLGCLYSSWSHWNSSSADCDHLHHDSQTSI